MRRGVKRNEIRTGWYFVLPSLIVLTAVVAAPLVFALLMSFYHYTFVNPRFNFFVGLENYIHALENPYFWTSLGVTLKFVILVVAIEFSIGLAVALALNRNIKFKKFYYTVLTIPLLMSPVSVGLIWKMFLHPDLGILNYFLSLLNVGPFNWLSDAKMAFWSVLMVDVWQQVSFMILLLLAGLSGLPREPYEAAKIDGAREVQQFFFITLPLMRPVISVALILRTIFAFRTYDLIYVLTRGGPGVSTEVLSYFIYRRTFMGLKPAEAAATSYILLIIIFALVVLAFKYIYKSAEE
ncbi:carbohydrate ABC transporter permease [Pseudothermotoga sp.]